MKIKLLFPYDENSFYIDEEDIKKWGIKKIDKNIIEGPADDVIEFAIDFFDIDNENILDFIEILDPNE